MSYYIFYNNVYCAESTALESSNGFLCMPLLLLLIGSTLVLSRFNVLLASCFKRVLVITCQADSPNQGEGDNAGEDDSR